MRTTNLHYNTAPDGNQKSIIDDLRKLGIKVYRMDKIGQGFPDILVGYKGKNYLFEIKDPNKKWVIKDTQKNWIKNWTGQVHIIFYTNRILEIIEFKHEK